MSIPEKLKVHRINLQGTNVTLRPMTEQDWDVLLRWNNDPEVLYYTEGEDVQSRSLADIQGLYRAISQQAFCFVAESQGLPIGECWLQCMNLDRILHRYPNLDCRRIDLMIGEKNIWGQGIGFEIVSLLTEFAFIQEAADTVFGCDIADYNAASLKIFQKIGYQIDATLVQPPNNKARLRYDLVLSRERFFVRFS